MKSLVSMLSLLILFTACKKSEEKTYEISGYLYNFCGGVPLKNEALVAWQQDPKKEQNRGYATTDSTGFFKIMYSSISNVVEIRFVNTTYAVLRYRDSSVQSKDVKNLKVYEQPTSTTVVSLNVLNAYTNQDTLEVTKGYGTNLKFAGPFINGYLFTIPNLEIITPEYINGKVGFHTGISWRLNNAPAYKFKYYDMIACETQQVTIDIQ